MSKVGKKPVKIPEGVEVQIESDQIVVRGPRGELTVPVDFSVGVSLEDGHVIFQPKKEERRMTKFARSMWGTTGALMGNAVEGVTNGFEKKLELVGVGYRAAVEGAGTLVLNLGYSHPIKYESPEGITISVEKNTITIQGIDKALVGQVAAKIRSYRKPEPYKGKGIKYKGEVIRRKAGKKVVGAGA